MKMSAMLGYENSRDESESGEVGIYIFFFFVDPTMGETADGVE